MRTDKQLLHDEALLELQQRVGPGQLQSENHSHFDLLLNGLRIEVKSGRRIHLDRWSKTASWQFNIHRHNRLDTRQLDFYALYCKTDSTAIWLVVPAREISCRTLYISWRSLGKKWGRWIDRFDLLNS